MHLIVFPLIIYMIAAGPILLLWPQRGLNQRNYWLTIGASMAGLSIGFVCMLLLSHSIHVSILIFLMFIFFPAIVALFIVHRFGTQGRVLGSAESALAKKPAVFFRALLFASLAGSLVSLACAWLLELEPVHIAMATTVILPTIFLLALLQANFLTQQTFGEIIKKSIIISAIILFSTFLLGPYFLMGLPLVLFGFASSFVFLYIHYMYQKS